MFKLLSLQSLCKYYLKDRVFHVRVANPTRLKNKKCSIHNIKQVIWTGIIKLLITDKSIGINNTTNSVMLTLKISFTFNFLETTF